MTQRRPIDLKLVDQLLAFRQAGAGSDDCPGLAAVSAVLVGGADADQIRAAGKHLETCGECAELVRAYRALEEKPAVEPAPRPSGFVPRLAWIAACLIALVAGGLSVWVYLSREREPVPSEGFLLKGGADTMVLAVQRGNTRFTARPGDRLEEGDRLGFFYSAMSAGHLAVIDLTASGESTVLFPQGSQSSSPIPPGERLALPDNGTVGKVESCEWLVAIFSDRPLPLSDLKERLSAEVKAAGPGCKLEPKVPGARTVWAFPLR
jgi:hypothetical protein